MEVGWSRDKVMQIILTDVNHLNDRKEEISKAIDDFTRENIEYLDALLEQISVSSSRLLISKTPKVLRKKNLKRIETIPEDDLIEIEKSTPKKISRKQSENQDDDIFVPPEANRRSKREASKKAGDSIKQQQSITLNSKMRRPSEDDNLRLSKASSRDSQAKRIRSLQSSDEEDANQPKKQIKKESLSSTRSTRNKPIVEEPVSSSAEEEIVQPSVKKSSAVKRKLESTESRKSKRTRSPQSPEPESKKANIIDETIDGPSPNDTLEPSMYEDAIGKAVPIMHSTMKPTSLGNQTRVISQTAFGNETHIIYPASNDTPTNNCNIGEPFVRMMNVTVVLENMKPFNETITISNANKERSNSRASSKSRPVSNSSYGKVKAAEETKEHNGSPFAAPMFIPKVALSKLKPVVELDPLITDDDSSPERKLPKERKLQKKHVVQKTETKPKRVTRSSLMSEDEVDVTPARKILGEMNNDKGRDAKNRLKKNMIFSPYAKESVRKKIEAFEQAVLSSPVVEVDSGMRLTRTKTRALAAAGDNEQNASTASIAQKLARKSLAKAKQISRAKDAKETEDTKENQVNSVQKLSANDKLVQKQQQRITPNSKTRLQMPSSVNRGATTPSNPQSLANYSKAMTGSRTNIVTNIDSFIQVKGSAQKPTSGDKMLEERKRKQQEDDAKKKRDETLKAQMEEKKRKREEKERKNRLAREAKEKQELEKRLKLEKEKEDKAKLAFQMQEKHREITERKRLELYKRAQEKEERRKQEEELRLHRLREQEEMERLLAEQKRREQEAERRRLAEAKAQQQAAAEAAKLKAHLLAAQNKKQAMAQNKQQQLPLNSYKIDSEPDSDSDDEMRPKHEIPAWARTHNRHKHLSMQEYVPMEAIMRFFDVKKCTPDLSDLFHGIDKNRLKRTSSAIWKTPPRFSMMEAIN